MKDEVKAHLDSISQRSDALADQLNNPETSQHQADDIRGELAYLESLHEAVTVIHVDLPALMEMPIHNRRSQQIIC